MTNKNCEAASRWNRLPTLLAAIFMFFLLSACGAGDYGTLARDSDLNNMFLNYGVLPDHRYYVTGGYDWPNAILAIHRDYELDNPGDLWVAFPNMNSGQMRKWIDFIAPEQNFRFSGGYFAAYILDLNGKRVGAWYATEPQTTVKFFEGNKIQVYPPDLIQKNNLNKGFRLRTGI